jgi:hypothetical protein
MQKLRKKILSSADSLPAANYVDLKEKTKQYLSQIPAEYLMIFPRDHDISVENQSFSGHRNSSSNYSYNNEGNSNSRYSSRNRNSADSGYGRSRGKSYDSNRSAAQTYDNNDNIRQKNSIVDVKSNNGDNNDNVATRNTKIIENNVVTMPMISI